MAIDNDLPTAKSSSVVFVSSSSSSSSSLSPINRRRHLIQVATDNSATFIQFPTNIRQTSLFVPVSRPRTSHSSAHVSSHTVDTQSLSNQSKSSTNDPSFSAVSDDHKQDNNQQRINPILNNPLLNHRKEPQKSPPKKPSSEYSRTTRLCLSSKPLKPTSNDTKTLTIRASTAPVLPHPKDSNNNISDRLINLKSEQQMQYVDENKYDYITRWLNEVRAATYSDETCLSKPKRTKRRLTTSS